MSTLTPMRQIPLPISAEPPRSFDSFLPGANAQAWAQLTELAQNLGAEAAPPAVYLWGPAGSGKTHLLQSFATHLCDQGRTVGWFDADTPLPWLPDEARGLTVFDRCDAFDPARQHAAFALFVDASSRGALVAAAGRAPPVDLPLREDLRSRLGWGLVIALQPLIDEEVRAVLLSEAQRRGLVLSKEATAYVLSHCPRDLASLKGLLARADAYTLAHKRADLTVPMIKQMLEDDPSAGTP
jgi:DnaA-homolog protein